MANIKKIIRFKLVALLFCLGLIGQIICTTPINISIQGVSDLLIQSALTSLNEDSPTKHTYKGGNLISAQKLLQPPYVIYRLTMSLEPDCNAESSCPREACVIDLKQNDQGVIEVDKKTTQCMYLYPQWNQDEQQLPSSEQMQDLQEQEIIENLDKQMINDTVKLDHEVQAVNDQNDRPFIAVRALHYCPGCPYELNPTLSGLEAFRETAALSLDKSNGNNYKHKVISIVRVTRAVPPGSDVVRYELLMEIGKTNCLVTTSIRRTECALSDEPIQLCLLAFDERPWLSNDRQLTRNNCTEPQDKIENTNGNVKPNLVIESLTNGDVDINGGDGTKSEIYDQIAQEGQISMYESPIDASLDVATPTAVTVHRDELVRVEITEIPFTQIVRNKDDIEKEPTKGFTDKMREFDEFLKNFDIPIKNIGEEKSLNHDHEVIEEIIRPERIQSKVNDENNEPNVELSRKKRSVLGKLSQSKFVLKLAQNAMNYLDEIDQDDKKRVIADVLESKKLESNNGTLYYITVLVVTTNCKENQKNIKNCIHEKDELFKICKIQVHTNDENSLQSAQIRMSECQNKKEIRSKRAGGAQSVPGGQQSIPIDDAIKNHVTTGLKHYSATSDGDNEPQLVEIISATRQIVSGEKLMIKVKIGESNCPKGKAAETCLLVESSPIKDCLITVWSQPWLNKAPVITVKCEASKNRRKRTLRGVNYTNNILNLEREWEHQPGSIAAYKESKYRNKNENRSKRVERGQSVPGSEQSVPIDDEIKSHAMTGLKHYSATSDGINEPQLVEIISATRQIVSGTKLRIKVKIGESNCPKGKAAETCLLVESSPIKDCLITVWSQPWLKKAPEITVECETSNNRRKRSLRGANYTEKMLKMSHEWMNQSYSMNIHAQSQHPDKHKRHCDKANHVHQMVGGPMSIPIDDDVKNNVTASLKQYSATSNSSNEAQLIEIINATRQVVSGIILRINVKIGESNCPKGHAAETCLLVENSPIKDCLISVWSQPWLNKDPEISVKCQPASSSRRKRSLRGVNHSNMMTQEMKDELDFDTFQQKYNRVYNSAEEKARRFRIFKSNMRVAEKFQEYEQGTAQYGSTKFADMTVKEFRAFTGYRSDLRIENAIPHPFAQIPDVKLDPEFDWRQYNVVTPVKDQGSCGSCWAFSVTGNVEGQYAIKHKQLLSLSEQELVDCDKLDDGCNGGLQENAYRALENLGGLESENDYPYDGEDEKCHFKKSKAMVQVVSAVNITSNETQMAQWLVKNGPMAIAINANAMQFYMGGISHPLSFLCNSDSLDHGVLIVGYGIHTYPIFKQTYPYWIVKNSWGTNWGEQGYYRVYRGDGTCGLNSDVTSAVVA